MGEREGETIKIHNIEEFSDLNILIKKSQLEKAEIDSLMFQKEIESK